MIKIGYPIDVYTFRRAEQFKTKKWGAISFYLKKHLRKDMIYLKT